MQDDAVREVIIIGAGPGGLCMGIRLQEAGIRDFVILEKAAGIGGTWWHNRYPGAECDVQSHLYSFSFAPKTDWSRPFAGQAEILEYVRGVAARFGVERYVQCNREVVAAHWDESRAHWEVRLADGARLRCRVLVSAMGMFNTPAWPDIPGLDSFEGTCFHSARWDHGHALEGERVAVIGSAASAVQFIPEIAYKVGRLDIYQRSANWVLPKADTPFTEAELERFRTDAAAVEALREEIRANLEGFITFSDPDTLRAAEEAGLRNMEVVRDPEVRRRLVPDHPYGCKRPLASNVYYPVFNEPHVHLITAGIDAIRGRRILAADGSEREVDTLILATGFHTGEYLSAIDVTGRNGQSLNDAWADGAQAYLGVATSGLPNLFMLYGPNTNNGSIIQMLEYQVDYILRQLRRLHAEGLAWVDVRAEVMEQYNHALQDEIAAVDVWQAACSGYYRAPSGRVVTQWPHNMAEYARRTVGADHHAFEVCPRD